MSAITVLVAGKCRPILESGNFCGAATCFMAATKKVYCPDCPFLSVDPGFSRLDTKKEDGSPIDLQCVENNIEYAGLSDYVTILDNTSGEEAPIRGPIGTFSTMMVRCTTSYLSSTRFGSLIS